jgi:DeoR family transcriptional regulator, aga operon transcriptional repressor
MTKKSSCIDRRMFILKKLDEDEQVNVIELSRQFKVSEVTIRKDLKYLEKKNILIRSRGGAMKLSLIDLDLSIYERRKKNIASKKAIGAMASNLINDGETILIDTGTTAMELAKQLPRKIKITIITNSLDIALRLAEYENIRLIMPGGILRRNSLALVGEQAAESLRNYYCDKYFLSADGINISSGIMTMNIEEAFLAKLNIKNSKKVIVLLDSSKFLHKSIISIAPLTDIDTLITDSGISSDTLAEIKHLGVNVIVVDKP